MFILFSVCQQNICSATPLTEILDPHLLCMTDCAFTYTPSGGRQNVETACLSVCLHFEYFVKTTEQKKKRLKTVPKDIDHSNVKSQNLIVISGAILMFLI